MRPFHEIMRLVGLEEGASIPEPKREDPMALRELGMTLFSVGRSFPQIEEGLEVFCREENIKPAVLMAAVRDVRVSLIGQPEAFRNRYLMFSARMDREGNVVFRSMQDSKRRHPSNVERG